MKCWCMAYDGESTFKIEKDCKDYDEFYEWFDSEFGYDVVADGEDD